MMHLVQQKIIRLQQEYSARSASQDSSVSDDSSDGMSPTRPSVIYSLPLGLGKKDIQKDLHLARQVAGAVTSYASIDSLTPPIDQPKRRSFYSSSSKNSSQPLHGGEHDHHPNRRNNPATTVRNQNAADSAAIVHHTGGQDALTRLSTPALKERTSQAPFRAIPMVAPVNISASYPSLCI
ncbi:uncharacterized protein BYT42DRAFT_95618 [Radiomyces spectabilis]|uniref:uncharacterized protein n=1 Tax=Radiomyces spectabilis TaxID=64574 RepID=UPI002220E6C2|nr:uncharacterized protein BYT42DRAFT_95618 [Radiomyces spectabilis]KAI8370606.1 hypothetical protein BYT42DRAFT_95618 [Radiomyces spectabilis]